MLVIGLGKIALGALQKVAEANKGKVAAATVSANRPSKQIMYGPQEDGTYIELSKFTEERLGFRATAVTSSGVTQFNVSTAATRDAGEH